MIFLTSAALSAASSAISAMSTVKLTGHSLDLSGLSDFLYLVIFLVIILSLFSICKRIVCISSGSPDDDNKNESE